MSHLLDEVRGGSVEDVTTTATDDPGPGAFRGRDRRWGLLFALVWLVFLVPVVVDAARLGGLRGFAGTACLLGFSVSYLMLVVTMRAYLRGRRDRPPWMWRLPRLTAALALAVASVLVVGGEALATAPFLAVIAVVTFSGRSGVLAVLAIGGAAEFLADRVFADSSLSGVGYSALGAGFAMFGVVQMIQRQQQIVRTEQARAQLALETERSRFGRDLHDILGHSLTVITVKAELAGRLAESDDPRARDRVRAEIADLERLSRDALADVRRTVEGYREITLAGELARARVALEAAGIRAEVSSSAEEAPSELREVFAWTVREGVTNVVRHSGASRCSVQVGAATVRIEDDGAGSAGDVDHGNGLRGLAERAAAAGARVVTRSVEPHGFSLSVEASR